MAAEAKEEKNSAEEDDGKANRANDNCSYLASVEGVYRCSRRDCEVRRDGGFRCICPLSCVRGDDAGRRDAVGACFKTIYHNLSIWVFLGLGCRGWYLFYS